MKFETAESSKLYLVAVAVVFGFILQIASFIYFYKKKLINNVDATDREERTMPYFASIVIYILGVIALLIFSTSHISIAFWFCHITNTFLVIYINKVFKISIHAIGAAGVLGLFTFVIGLEAIIMIPLLFIVSWSRIKLRVHSFSEVFAGSLFGYFSIYIQLYLFLR